MPSAARHANIPIFVPQLGCPHACIFCDQKSITGQAGFDPAALDTAMAAVGKAGKEREIAFFGGSFTAIPRPLMITLLERAAAYVAEGRAAGIRLSTRPDAVGEEVLTILRRYPVTTVELGIQSTDDRVLNAALRGHDAATSAEACRRVKAFGFELVGQMMIGLPESTPAAEEKTARDLVAYGVDAARIYPLLVFPDTALFDAVKKGRYRPLTVTEAVARTMPPYEIFAEAMRPVIRIGLCESDGLRHTEQVAGPYHPALGELVLNEFYYRKIAGWLSGLTNKPDKVGILSAPGTLSQVIGQKKRNLRRLEAAFPGVAFTFGESERAAPRQLIFITKEN